MRLKTDVGERTVGFEVPRSMYSREGLDIANQIFSPRAEIYLEESAKTLGLTLKSKRKASTPEELERLGGEFLNELLNQEYRFVVGRFNQKISGLIVTQALFSARGGEEPPKPPVEEQTPEFKEAVVKMMRDAAEEIKRTMPKKLPPQGNPLPPAKEE